MKLPLKYTETMKALLGEEYDAYLASFDEERFYGLRVNTQAGQLFQVSRGRGCFLSGLCHGAKRGFIMTGQNALPSIRITMQGCIICRSQAP